MAAETPAAEPSPRYRFVGEAGQYLEGVPARDLTQEDVDALTDEQRAAVEASPLYEAPGGGEAEPPAAGKKE